MRSNVLFVLLVLFTSACAAPDLLASHPALTLVADASADPVQRVVTFRLDSNLPLAGAQLLYGAEGGRAPIDVPLAPGAQYATYALKTGDSGLSLPRGLDDLRYSWTARDTEGSRLTVVQSLTSTLFVRDDSVPALRWQSDGIGSQTLYYVPGSPAERDLDRLRQVATESMARAVQALDAIPTRNISVYLLPRIFWQGGVTFGNGIVMISYADRGYTGVSPDDYLAHEDAHALSQEWGNLGNAGGMLSEGTAVFATGGHYQPDLLDRSAATLVQSPLYIAPSILRRDFSNLQHEIAYTESGSFVKYLVDHYGLDKLRMLYRRPNDWQTIFGKDFDGLTGDWLAYLRTLNAPPLELRRWQLKVRFYDVLRQYEERLDPDARRLPTIPVDHWDDTLRNALSKPAEGEDNQVFELLLVSAVADIETASDEGRLSLAAASLDEVDRKLATPTASDSPVVADVRAIVRAAQSLSLGLLDRDAVALLNVVDTGGYPQFANQLLVQAAAQPAWLTFRLAPTNLVLTNDIAFLTVAQWNEPIDDSKPIASNGERWVLALHKTDGVWKMTGHWPETTPVLMAR